MSFTDNTGLEVTDNAKIPTTSPQNDQKMTQGESKEVIHQSCVNKAVNLQKDISKHTSFNSRNFEADDDQFFEFGQNPHAQKHANYNSLVGTTDESCNEDDESYRPVDGFPGGLDDENCNNSKS